MLWLDNLQDWPFEGEATAEVSGIPRVSVPFRSWLSELRSLPWSSWRELRFFATERGSFPCLVKRFFQMGVILLR